MDEPVSSVLVVGIGASAGGIDSLKEFFSEMPADSGLTFVVVQHLDPTHASHMAGLLARQTTMKVAEAQDESPIQANRIYTIPPNKFLSVRDGMLRLTEAVKRDGLRLPIDFFFRSLAQDQHEKAIAVLFSGSGSDGTLGIREIRGTGGLVIVQNPETAQFDSMIESAIATGLVDYVLPIRQIPGKLLQYVKQPRLDDRADVDQLDDVVSSILNLLVDQNKSDFRCYKRSTVQRRIERRMGLSQISDISDYYCFLCERPDERAKLSKDMLIGVTSFFRDAEAFENLRVGYRSRGSQVRSRGDLLPKHHGRYVRGAPSPVLCQKGRRLSDRQTGPGSRHLCRAQRDHGSAVFADGPDQLSQPDDLHRARGAKKGSQLIRVRVVARQISLSRQVGYDD